MHAGQPILAERGRWADPRVAGDTGVTQGMNVRAILVDPCVYLISSADGPVAGDEDIRKHVAGDENPAFLDQQRRMARGMRLMLDDPDLRAIPRNLRHLGG